MVVDFHAHRFWDDPALEREETVSANHEELLAAMEKANAEKLAKLEAAGAGPDAKPRLTPQEMMERAMERARRLRAAALPPGALQAPAPPAQEAEEAPPPAPAPIPRGKPPKALPRPQAPPDDEWETLADDRYDGGS